MTWSRPGSSSSSRQQAPEFGRRAEHPEEIGRHRAGDESLRLAGAREVQGRAACQRNLFER